MSSFRSEPILWVHVAGLAALPIFLGLCLWLLAVGEQIFPVWVELLIVAGIGILPVLWMQLFRPFYIFAILGIALKPELLTLEQLKILSLINTQLNRVLAVFTAVLLVGILLLIYYTAPLISAFAPFPSGWRGISLLLAGLAFLGCNLFLQIPVSVMRVFVTSETEFASIEPLQLHKVSQNFTIFGVRVQQIFPPFVDKLKTED